MAKTTAVETAKKRQRVESKPATNGAEEPKPKRRRMRQASSGFVGELRELAAKYRAKLEKITGPEQELERKLAGLRAQRAEAEGMLVRVENMLSQNPELPGIQSHERVDQVTEIAPLDEARNDGTEAGAP